MDLLAERFVFWGDDRGFLEERVKAYQAASTLPLNSPTFFPRLHICIVYGTNTAVYSSFFELLRTGRAPLFAFVPFYRT